MKLNIYTIFDLQADRAITPFMRDNDNVAIRDFISTISSADGPFSKNPDDYSLYWIGVWDDETMLYNDAPSLFMEPKRVMTGREAYNKRQLDTDKIAELHREIEAIKAGLNGTDDLNQSTGMTT